MAVRTHTFIEAARGRTVHGPARSAVTHGSDATRNANANKRAKLAAKKAAAAAAAAAAAPAPAAGAAE